MKKFMDLKIATKLLLSFSSVALVAGIIGVVGYVNTMELNDRDTFLYEKTTLPLGDMVVMDGNFERQRYNLAMAVNANDRRIAEEYIAKVKQYGANFDKAAQHYTTTFIDENDKMEYDKLIVLDQRFDMISEEFYTLVRTNKKEEAFALLRGKLADVSHAESAQLESITKGNVDAARETSDANTTKAGVSIRLMIILAVVGTLVALGLGFMISRMISKPIGELAGAAAAVAKGDLNVAVQLKSQDEVGELTVSFNQMVDSIREGQENLLREKAGVEAKVAEAVAEIAAKEEYLNRSINRMMVEMEKLSQGDLKVQLVIERDDSIGRLFSGFNDSIAHIREMLLKVSEALAATASASSEISSSTEQMAAGAQEQTQQATEVAGAVEEMSKTIVETTRNANLASEAAKASGLKAQEGGLAVMKTMEGMVRIADVVKQSAETVLALGRSSDQIGEIVQVIDDIADQTNLLALNAAIEAARAGEQGRGFAVVADEVRKLAERTTKATKEIATMIKQIQKDTTGAVQSMSRGTEEVETGRELAEKSSQSLQEIIDGSVNVVDVITQVAAASEQQASASEQISKNIEAISSVTQESAAGTQQIARAAEDLNQLTSNLQELLGQFSLGNEPEPVVSRHEVRGTHRLSAKGKMLFA
jgi:methyl-accepting chemotaxis protein